RDLPPETLIAIARIMEKVMAVLLAAGAAVWMVLLLERMVAGGGAWGLTLVFALCTPIWAISSQALWQHSFGPIAILISLYGLVRWETSAAGNRWLWLCGVGAALALLIRPTNVWLLVGILVALPVCRLPMRDYIRAILPSMILLAPLLLY